MEWQPIDTAPMDGTRLLLSAMIRNGQRVFIGGYDPSWSGQCWLSENHSVPAGYQPTHWMHLPANPGAV